MSTLTFGSLFSGIGGIELGLEQAGLECKWQVEINEYAAAVLGRHWPLVPKWRDVTKFAKQAHLHPVDLVCGGFPCQPVSLAGARRGDSDERWLWDSFREVVAAAKPTYVLAENVPGLLSANDGRLFGTVVGDLASMGYDCEWGCIPAAAFDLPHLRYRVFIIAFNPHPAGFRCNEEGSRLREAEEQTRRSGRPPDRDDQTPRDTASQRLERLRRSGEQEPDSHARETISLRTGQEDWRTVEPTIRRGDDGFSNRVDRIRCLGNAVAPPVARWLGKRILTFHQQREALALTDLHSSIPFTS